MSGKWKYENAGTRGDRAGAKMEAARCAESVDCVAGIGYCSDASSVRETK